MMRGFSKARDQIVQRSSFGKEGKRLNVDSIFSLLYYCTSISNVWRTWSDFRFEVVSLERIGFIETNIVVAAEMPDEAELIERCDCKSVKRALQPTKIDQYG